MPECLKTVANITNYYPTSDDITSKKPYVPKTDVIMKDPYYNRTGKIGQDMVKYKIKLSDIKGTPATVKVTMNYQSIPPAYLASRFKDGYKGKVLGPATKRIMYMASRLNLNKLDLKSTPLDDNSFDVVKNWTIRLSQDRKSVK